MALRCRTATVARSVEGEASSAAEEAAMQPGNVVGVVFVGAAAAGLAVLAVDGFTGGETPVAAAATGAVESGAIAAQASGFAFPDGTRTVAIGTTVTWTNADPASHTVTSGDGTFTGGVMASGESVAVAFPAAGIFTYFCEFHPEMTGAITVVDGSAPPASGEQPATTAPSTTEY
jgi:plastocyanin